jgi:hypothetical protein
MGRGPEAAVGTAGTNLFPSTPGPEYPSCGSGRSPSRTRAPNVGPTSGWSPSRTRAPNVGPTSGWSPSPMPSIGCASRDALDSPSRGFYLCARDGACGNCLRLKREPGSNPGLPRSGNRERTSSRALVPRGGWEATKPRKTAKAEALRKPEDLPASVSGRNPEPVSTWSPRGRGGREQGHRRSVVPASVLFSRARFSSPRGRRSVGGLGTFRVLHDIPLRSRVATWGATPLLQGSKPHARTKENVS